MSENNSNTCRVVAVPFPVVDRNVECVGPWFLRYLNARNQNTSEQNIVRLNQSEKVEATVVFEDDVEYLRSLDPKEWKDQDHYAVLGLKHLRFKATEDDLKKAYRQKVLKHHPDKRKALGEEVRSDDDYFTCITKAYEILGNPSKRRSYDSVDPLFDDSLPSTSDLKKDFYATFLKYFDLNARWSEKKNVPKLGSTDTCRQEVEHFYNFWYNFESWREFSYLDEEEKEKGQDREERRWIEKQNKIARAKRKKEEMSRIRTLVDMAYNNDPRIAKFKQEEKDRKLAAKRAKQSAVQARREEEERALREAQLAKEKAEAAERARIEAIRQEREAQKRALKKERKAFRDLCKSNDYYSSNSDEAVSHMAAVEKICEILKILELEQLNKELKADGRPVFVRVMNETEQKIEAERQALFEKTASSKSNNSAAGSTKPTNLKSASPDWTTDNVQLLIKAVNLFPAGTNQRWEVVANFINQHGDTSGGTYNAKDVLAKAKDLQKTDFSKNNLKTDVNKQAFSSFEKNKKNVKTVDDSAISKNVEVNGHGSENNQDGCKTEKLVSKPWTPEEQQLLEQALKTYPAATGERWDRIAECLPNRSKKDCMRRYKELVDLVKAKKAAQAAVKPKS